MESVPRNSSDVVDLVFGLAGAPAEQPSFASLSVVQQSYLVSEVLLLGQRWLSQTVQTRSTAPKKRVFSCTFPEIKHTSQEIDHVKARLLYLPGGVTYDDPLYGACAEFIGSDDPREARIAKVQQAIDFMQDARPLIASGDMVLTPGFIPYLQSFAEAQKILKDSGWTSEPTSWTHGEGGSLSISGHQADLWTGALVLVPAMCHYDVVLEKPSSLDVFERWHEMSPVDLRRDHLISRVHGDLVGRTRDLTLPFLTNFAWADIHRLRSESDTFDEFRQGLGQAIRLLTEDSEVSPGDVADAFTDVIGPRRDVLRKTVAQSEVFEQSVIGTLSIGGAVAEYWLTGAPPVGTGLALGAAEASWLVRYSIASPERKKAGRLREFYTKLMKTTEGD